MVISSPCLTNIKNWLVQSKRLLIATVETLNDGEQQITVTVDGHKFFITEASVRIHLQLADVDGINSFPNPEIFEQLSLMGFSRVHVPLFDTMLPHDQPGQGEGPTLSVESQHTPTASSLSLSQPTFSQVQSSHEPNIEPIPTTSSPHPQETQGRVEEKEYADVEEENAGVEYDFNLTEQQQKSFAEASKEKIKTYNRRRRRRRSTDRSQVSTAACLVSTAEDIQNTDEEQTKDLEQQEQERANLEAALKLQNQFDQESKEADNIDWSKIVEQVQERQSGSMVRYQALKKKPVIVAQARKNMMNSEVEKTKKKRISEETLLQESFKKLRTAKASSPEPIPEHSTEETKEFSEEDLNTLLEIVPVEEFRVEALQTKYPIIDLEIHTEGSRKYWKIIRTLVKESFTSAEPVEDMEKALWAESKRLYEPYEDDTLWKLQRYMHDPLTWRLYGSCAVHHVSSTRGHHIYMLIEMDYPLTTKVMTLMLRRRLQVEEDTSLDLSRLATTLNRLERSLQIGINNEFQVMPFGLTNTPAVFMDLMNRVCKPYLDNFVIVFIDDILIYSKNKQEHEEHLKLILELFKKEELYAKFSKWEFWIPKAQFFSHVIDSQSIHMDPAKIESIKDWASLKLPTKIR
ncbi:putative reverse transcriptase domain-containing protein [Tanacetum coccineum]